MNANFLTYLKLKSLNYHKFGLFAIKAGLASAAVYYINEQGIWRDSNESEKTYNKLKDTVSPYVKKATTQLPFEVPQLPERNIISSIAKETWNNSILITFKFITDLPDKVSGWTSKGIDAAKKNEEIKKLLDSFSSGTEKVK